jgi:macrolide-specific efflux system membrane fusion protein
MKTLRNAAAKPWIVMPLVAVLALGGWFLLRPDETADNASAQGTDQVVEATVGDMALTVSAEGTVAAADTEDLSFTSAGTVTAVNVEAGQTVTAGDVLATLDSAELEADVADAEASVAEAEAALEDDEAAGASDAQLAADQSSLTAAEDRLATAEEALESAQLVASFDGTVAAVNVTVGEELASGGVGGTSSTGTQSGSGQSAGDLGSGDQGFAVPGGSDTEDTSTTGEAHVQIVSTSSFVVELGFDDTDIANVAEGQEVTVTLSTSSGGGGAFAFPGGGGAFPGGLPGGGAFPGAEDTEEEDDGTTAQPPPAAAGAASVTGEVVEVGQVADASSGVASYPVTVAFSDDSGDYNVGATVSVEITYDQVVDAVQIPSFAVTTTDGVSTVTVSTDGGEETRTVTTGLTEGTMVQITSGLEAGEEVIISFPEGPGGGGGQGGPPAFGAATEGSGS